jgi:hypothetical protein
LHTGLVDICLPAFFRSYWDYLFFAVVYLKRTLTCLKSNAGLVPLWVFFEDLSLGDTAGDC